MRKIISTGNKQRLYMICALSLCLLTGINAGCGSFSFSGTQIERSTQETLPVQTTETETLEGESAEAETKEAEATDPQATETAESKPSESVTVESETVESEMTEPETAEPETVKSETAESEILETETTAPLSEEALAILNRRAGKQVSLEEIELVGEDHFFTVSDITDEIFDRIYGLSFKSYCTVPRDALRYVRCLHTDLEGDIYIGEIIVNEMIAEDICEIFHALYKASYPIDRMVLVDEYGADDYTSIKADNTSAFNYRKKTGESGLSNHAYGLAIDINPYYNVYYEVADDYVAPTEAYKYKDRSLDFPYKIEPGDLCYELFMERGFTWGGNWTDGVLDYQHFEMNLPDSILSHWQ